MDQMDLRVLITVISFLCFIGIVIWAYSGRQKTRFEEAANLPFADDEMQQKTMRQKHQLSDKQSKPDTLMENNNG